MPETYDMTTVKRGKRQDEDLYKYIVTAYERSKKYLEDIKLFENAQKYAKIYDGEIWDVAGSGAEDRPIDLSKVNISLAFDVIETGLAVATSRPPAPEVDAEISADNEQYQQIAQMFQSDDQLEVEQAQKQLEAFKQRIDEYAEQMQRELVRVWESTHMHGKNQVLYREHAKVGISLLKSVYDSSTGKIVNVPMDLSCLYPSPNCDSIVAHGDEKEPLVIATVMSVDKVKREYGIEEIDDAAIGDGDELKVLRYETQGYRARIKAAIKSGLTVMMNKEQKKGTHVIVLECYMPDDTEIDVNLPDYDDDGLERKNEENQPITKPAKRKQFASGFKIVTVILHNKGWIVDERENLYKNGRPPIFELVNYKQLGSLYGTSELKHIADLIMRVNVVASNMNDNIRLTGNPALILGPGTQALDDGPITNKPGLILESPTGQDHYLLPPPLGNDSKWFLEFLVRFINQLSRLDAAIRGVNENASDSGRKIRELRQAAAGLFQPKLDEQVRFSTELYDHWTYIYQNLYEGQILQKAEDVNGQANFEEFIPSAGQGITLNVSVSTDSILPKDIWSEWEEALQLYNMIIPGTQDVRLITPEALVRAAPSFSEKQEAIAHIGREQEKVSFEKQRMAAFEQFTEIAEQASEISEQAPGTPEEEELAGQLIQIIQMFPEFIRSNEFAALSERLRLAIMAALAQQVSEPQEQAA